MTRFAMRMLPIYMLLKANPSDFKQLCSSEITRLFSSHALKWCFEFKSRNNQKCLRADFLQIVKDSINSTEHSHSVSYDCADYDIVVESFRDILVFGCLRGYKNIYKRYNIQQL